MKRMKTKTRSGGRGSSEDNYGKEMDMAEIPFFFFISAFKETVMTQESQVWNLQKKRKPATGVKAQPGFTGTRLPPLSSSGSSQSVSGGRDVECGRVGREDESGDVSQETGRARQITLLSRYQFYLLDPNLLIPLILISCLLLLLLTSPLLCLPVTGPRIPLRLVPRERVCVGRVCRRCLASRVEGLDRIRSHLITLLREEGRTRPFPMETFFNNVSLVFLCLIHPPPPSSPQLPSASPSSHRCSRSRRN